MPKRSSKSGETGRESTYRVIVAALKDHPAYLLLFAIGLLGGALGLGATGVGFVTQNMALMVLGFASWALLLVVAVLVIRMVERRPAPSAADPRTQDLLDQSAEAAFFDGPSAAFLSGRWSVQWYGGEGASRAPYAPDPTEEVVVSTAGCRVACNSYDPSTKCTYWMDGRLSSAGVLTLMYWSKPEPGIATLTGVVLLVVDNSFEARGRKLAGWWRGYGREGKVVYGDVEWTKRG